MHTNNIKAVFKEYLLSNRPNAVLINGAWGSGKTHFWKNELAPLVVSANLKPVYISLNGISKVEILEHQLFIKMVPFLQKSDSKTKANWLTISKNIGDGISKFFLKSSITDVFKGVSLNFFNYSEYLICFDDLERCQIPIKEVLGYINDFVEHKGLKAVFLADETNISVDQSVYSGIKEKIIGRVLNFSLLPEQILPHLFADYKINTQYHSFLENHKAFLSDLFLRYRLQNLRTISYYLDVLCHLYSEFSLREESIIKELMLFTLTICIEFRSGNLESKDADDYKELDQLAENYYYMFLARPATIGILEDADTDETDNEDNYAKAYCSRYYKDDIGLYHFYPTIYTYVLSGYLDLPKFKHNLGLRKVEVVPPQIEAYRKLINYHFRNLSNEEFEATLTKVKQYATEGVYTIYDYIQIADFYFYFSGQKLIELTKDEIFEFIFTGLERAKVHSTIIPRAFEDMMLRTKDNSDINMIKVRIVQLHKAMQSNILKETGSELIDALNRSEKETVEKIFKDNSYNRLFLKSIDMDNLADCIMKLPNPMLSLLNGIIADRYRSGNIVDFLIEDIEPLQYLEQKFQTELATDRFKPLQKFMLNDLLIWISKSILNLQRSINPTPPNL